MKILGNRISFVSVLEKTIESIVLFIMVWGISSATFKWAYDNSAHHLENQIEFALNQDGAWKRNEKGTMYLDIQITPRLQKYIFTEGDVVKIVKEKVTYFNYVVRSKRNNQSVGIYVGDIPERYNHKVVAFYDEQVLYLRSTNSGKPELPGKIRTSE